MIDNGDKNDFELVAQYRRGDTGAMEMLVERYRGQLFGFLCKMTVNRHDAEEVFQETWIRAIKNIGKYRDNCFAAWIFRIARNLIIDRRRSRRDLVSLDRSNEDGGSLQDMLADKTSSPADQAAYADLRTRLAAALYVLPDEQREMFFMRMDGGLSFKEAAAAQGVSINTALARMQYALEKLRVVAKAEGWGGRYNYGSEG